MRKPVLGVGKMCWADVIVAYHRAMRSFEDVVQPVLAASGHERLGITNVLFLLAVGRGQRRFADIVREGNYAGSNASYALTNLVDAGLVVRVSDPKDRRLRIVEATPEGNDLIEAICRVSVGDDRAILGALKTATHFERLRPPRSAAIPVFSDSVGTARDLADRAPAANDFASASGD